MIINKRKSRLWDIENKNWMPADTLIKIADEDDFNGILQESLNKFDRNNKEIFDGDIIKFSSELNVFYKIHYSNLTNGKYHGENEVISIICFKNGQYIFDWMFGYEGQEVHFEDVEIIGNICENPEILEKVEKEKLKISNILDHNQTKQKEIKQVQNFCESNDEYYQL